MQGLAFGCLKGVLKRGVEFRQHRPITEHLGSDRITGLGQSRSSSEDQKNGDITSKPPLDNVQTDDMDRLPSDSSGIRSEISPRGCLGARVMGFVRGDLRVSCEGVSSVRGDCIARARLFFVHFDRHSIMAQQPAPLSTTLRLFILPSGHEKSPRS